MQWMTLATLSAPPTPAIMSAAVASKPVRPSVRPVVATASAAGSVLVSFRVAVAAGPPAATCPGVTSSPARWVALLVRTTMAVVALPAAATALRSMVPRGWPLRTRSPALTVILKGAPLSSTVSTPRWSRTSRPESVLSPMACPVAATSVTVPSTGATTWPASGSTPKPSPTAPEEKTGSGMSASGIVVPETGAARRTCRSGAVVMLVLSGRGYISQEGRWRWAGGAGAAPCLRRQAAGSARSSRAMAS